MNQRRAPHSRLPRATRPLVVVALSAFLLKAVIALTTYGSTDILIFEADLAKVREAGSLALYREGIRTEWCGHPAQRPCPPFNHPPLVIAALEGWAALARVSNLPLRFWLRFTCALADLGSLLLLAAMLRAHLDDRGTRSALLLFAASPISILVSGFHGNTDPLMIFLLLLSTFLAQTDRPAWIAGIALGASASVKILPVLLVPAVLVALRGWRRRVEFSVGAALTWLAGASPVLVSAPELLATRVLGYRSQSGTWGLSLLAAASLGAPESSWLWETYDRHGRMLSVLLALGAAFWPRSRPGPSVLFFRAGFVMLLLVASAPGFGVQYLSWLVPWVVVLGAGPALAYYGAGVAFLAAYYTSAAGEFPWYLANSLARPAWNPTVIGLGLLCWLVIATITVISARRLARSDPAP